MLTVSDCCLITNLTQLLNRHKIDKSFMSFIKVQKIGFQVQNVFTLSTI